LTNQNKPCLFSNLVLWNNPLEFEPDTQSETRTWTQ